MCWFLFRHSRCFDILDYVAAISNMTNARSVLLCTYIHKHVCVRRHEKPARAWGHICLYVCIYACMKRRSLVLGVFYSRSFGLKFDCCRCVVSFGKTLYCALLPSTQFAKMNRIFHSKDRHCHILCLAESSWLLY